MMVRLASVLCAALAILVSACTSDPESQPLPEPVEVETCEGLIGVGAVYVERMVLALDGLDVDVLTGEAEPPNDVAALIRLGEELDARAARLECDVRELNAAILEETGNLDPGEDQVVGLFLDLVRGGVIAELPPAPTTTTTSPPPGA